VTKLSVITLRFVRRFSCISGVDDATSGIRLKVYVPIICGTYM
jgi:hypothetical protein